MTALTLQTMIGDYPVTRALKAGEVNSSRIRLEFADVPQPQKAFKRVVREVAFDVAELAIVTFLMAKARGVPLTLLPAVMTARFQHPYIVYNAAHGPLSPDKLNGRRIGIRSYTVTTVTWIRGMLANDYGVDLDSLRWVTFEDAHVAGFSDPPGVERAGEGQDLVSMLRAGEIDAAIVGAPVDDPQIKTLFPDPVAAAEAWQTKHRAIQINHMIVVKSDLVQSQPEAVRDVYRMLNESKSAAGLPPTGRSRHEPLWD